MADIVRRHGSAYRQKFDQRLLPRHHRALADIEACRTAAFGGQVSACDRCRQKIYAYHACKNRHCPKCHGDKTRRWLDKQRARLLLHCPFYLLTFTLPAELRAVARAHPTIVYRLLMQSAAAAILKLARDPRFLGPATPGLLAVLHTWTRAMLFHPHTHLLVTAGAMSDDGLAWIKPKYPRFLLPERALSEIFQGKFRHRLGRGVHLPLPRPRAPRGMHQGALLGPLQLLQPKPPRSRARAARAAHQSDADRGHDTTGRRRRRHRSRHDAESGARPDSLSALQHRSSRRARADPAPATCPRETAVTFGSVLASCVDSRPRSSGCLALVLVMGRMDPLCAIAKLRNAACDRRHSASESESVDRRRDCLWPPRLI